MVDEYEDALDVRWGMQKEAFLMSQAASILQSHRGSELPIRELHS